MTSESYRAVFVSPHLDDAVFSCGGTIAALAGEGPVLVLNLFSSYPAAIHRGPVVVSQGRFEEDANAAALLGFRIKNLDEVDAALRHPVYRSPANLFRPPIPEDIEALSGLSRKIGDFLSSIKYDTIYLPLGIGWHVDHALAFLATEQFHMDSTAFLYEDAPYCLIQNLTKYRLREIGSIDGKYIDHGLCQRSSVREWYESSRDYATTAPIMRFSRPLRWMAALGVSLYIRGLFARSRRNRVTGSNRRVIKPYLQNVTAHHQTKIDACYQYESQIGQFFGSRADCEARYRTYSAAMAQGAREMYERFWQFQAA